MSVILYCTFSRRKEKIGHESQNQGMVGVGSDLWRSSPIPAKADSPGAGAHDHIQVDLEYLQRRRVDDHPGQPV